MNTRVSTASLGVARQGLRMQASLGMRAYARMSLRMPARMPMRPATGRIGVRRMATENGTGGDVPKPEAAAGAGGSSGPKDAPGWARRIWRFTPLRILVNVVGGSALFGGGLLVLAFAYDAYTYRVHVGRCDDLVVPKLALSPHTGGPKNLPIGEALLDDAATSESQSAHKKPHLVILGTGWGAVSLLNSLKPDEYRVTVVSPTNYFLFTPLLPSVTVGMVNVQSVMEPVRRLLTRLHGTFLEGAAESVEIAEQLIEIRSTNEVGQENRFYLPYDKLVVAVGAQSNTHGVKGLQYCNQLKTVQDALACRNKILRNFEEACLPSTSDEDRKRLLSFVVCGGGPTGVEFAAELSDMIHEDLARYYPRLLRNQISIHIIQSRDHILNTYDANISEFAERHLKNEDLDVITNSRVEGISENTITYTTKTENGIERCELPYGMCLWSTGVSLTPLTKSICSKLPDQHNQRAIETDSHLRVIGAPNGTLYAIGDCATVRNDLSQHLVEFISDLKTIDEKSMDSVELSYADFCRMAETIRIKFPQASQQLRKLDKIFSQFDQDRSGSLSLEEVKLILEHIDKSLTSLPATAQRASQQGVYLGKKFNKIARVQRKFAAHSATRGDIDGLHCSAFKYNNLGSLAYLGNSAVASLPGGYNISGGILAMYAWRSVYFSQQVSLRSRLMLVVDWMKRGIWGRDISIF